MPARRRGYLWGGGRLRGGPSRADSIEVPKVEDTEIFTGNRHGDRRNRESAAQARQVSRALCQSTAVRVTCLMHPDSYIGAVAIKTVERRCLSTAGVSVLLIDGSGLRPRWSRPLRNRSSIINTTLHHAYWWRWRWRWGCRFLLICHASCPRVVSDSVELVAAASGPPRPRGSGEAAAGGGAAAASLPCLWGHWTSGLLLS